MSKLFILTSFLFSTFFLNAQSSDYFYFSPKGQESLKLSYQQILIQFEENTSFEVQQEILEQQKLIVPLTSNALLPSPKVTIAELVDIEKDDDLFFLLKQLQQTARIKFAYPMFIYADGTRMAPQSKLLVRLKNNDHYPLLENATLLNPISIEKSNDFDPLLFHINITDASVDPLVIAQELFLSKLFDYVEPDFLRFLTPMSTNDPALGDQWSIENTGQLGGTIGADMRVKEAWELITGKPSVRVAIIDEGVDLNHPDLIANMLPGYDATEQNSGGAPSGNDAHGTACAGIATGVGNNELGMAGVAYNSMIVPVRIAYSDGENWVTSSAWVGNALNWAWQEGQADVISNSWGGGGASFTINNAIDNGATLGRNGLGCPMVFAAGNDNTIVSYPADYDVTIAVGAMSMCYERKTPSACDGETWWGSNFGTHLDVVAPGAKIYATDISGSAGYSSSNFAAQFNGTSAATPNVSGVLALIISANENLTEQQVRYALESTCRKVGNYTYEDGVVGQPTSSWNNEMGYGLVNALAAVQSVAPSQNDDAGIMEIIRPTSAICGSSIQPTVRLRNNGSNNLTSTTIHTKVSGGQEYTYNWTGNLASTETIEVNLPAIPVTAKAHYIEVYTSNPNNANDANTNNDRAFATFSIGDEEFVLTVTLDNYGSETTWDLMDAQQEVLMRGGPYENNAIGKENEEKFCLPAGCYTLTFYDEYDDGMCCGYGNGGYELVEVATSKILATGGQYTDKSAHPFCIEANPSGGEPIEEEPSPDPLTVKIDNVQNVSCFNQNNGTATAIVQGGTAPFSYQWSNGTTTATVNNLNAGSHQVTIKDAANQSVSTQVAITQPTILQLNVNSSNATDNENGSANVSVNGGIAPYSYQWSNGATTASINGLNSGTYTVTVTDNNNCTKSATVTVGNNETPPLQVTIINVQDIDCSGDTNGAASVAVSGGTPPYSYVWSNQETTSAVNNLPEGAFYVTVYDSKQRSAIAEQYINAPAPIILNTTSTNALDNQGGTATVNVDGGTKPYVYQWSNGRSTATIEGLNSGIYTVTVTDNNDCVQSTSVTVSNDETPPLQVAIIDIQEINCNGDANGAARVRVSGGTPPYSYVWSNQETTSAVNNLPEGSFYVTVYDNKQRSATAEQYMNAPAPIILNTTSTNALDNQGGTATVNADGGVAPYFYQWSNGGTTATIEGLNSGIYTVTVIDNNDCLQSTSVTVGNDETPPLQVIIVDIQDINCSGDANGAARVEVNGGTPPYSYVWSNQETTSAVNNLPEGSFYVTVYDNKEQSAIAEQYINAPAPIILNTTSTNALDNQGGTATVNADGGVAPYFYQWSNGGTTATVEGLNSGIYTVTVIDNNDCLQSTSVTVGNDETPPLQVIIVDIQDINCSGDANGAARVEVNGGTPPYSYVWSNQETTSAVNNLPEGSFYVTVYDSKEQSAIAEQYINAPAPIILNTTSTNALDNQGGTATVNADGGVAPYFYQWSNGGTTATVEGLNSGIYTVTVIDNNDCVQSTSVTVGNDETPPLEISIINIQSIDCKGNANGSASVQVNGGIAPYTYLWSNEATTKDVNNLSEGMFYVAVRDGHGKAARAEAYMEAPNPLILNTSSTNAIDNQNGTATVVVVGGVEPYTYRWSNGRTTATIDNLASGLYVVNITDENGCTRSANVIVENDETPALTASITNIQALRCYDSNDGRATVEVSGGTPPYTYAWSNGATSLSVNNLPTGETYVVVQDEAGRIVRAETFMEAPSSLNLNISSVSALDNQNGRANVIANGGTRPYSYRWSNGSTTATIENLTAGNYDVTVYDSNDCFQIATITVENEITPDPLPTIVFENGQIEALSTEWQTIALENSYESMVVIASVRLPNVDAAPVVTRIRDAVNNQFQIKLQNAGGNTSSTYIVDYFVIEEGVYNKEDHGITMEAVKANSEATAGRNNWIRERRVYQNDYDSPVVLGQVMTYNDERWSVFWSSVTNKRNAPPNSNSFAAGKHVGEDPANSRSNETIGYVVIESGIQQINDTKLYTALGADQIRGVSNTTNGYTYNINGLGGASTGVISASGMDSNNGGWPVFLGEDAVSKNSIRLVYDEDQQKDIERAHTTEQVAFIIFEDEAVEEEEVAPLKFEYGNLAAVNSDWQPVTLNNTYESMVVVATVMMDNQEQLPAVTRITGATGSQFSIKIQNPGGQDGGNYRVQYFVIEEGIYNEFDHGVTMEAVKMVSTKTSARRKWEYESRNYNNNYALPVVLGQVMSFNDERWSAFWANNGNRKKVPTATKLSVGKHVGESLEQERLDETLGYVVFEAGNGELNGFHFNAGVGADRIYGMYNTSSGYRYGIEGVNSSSTAILSSAGMDGSDCGWPVLFGEDAISDGQLIMVIEEDDAKDEERAHPSEQVAYVVFDIDNTIGFNSSTAGSISTDSTFVEEAVELEFNIKAFPNPTIDWITLESNQILVGQTDVQIYTVNGQNVQQKSIQLDPKAQQQFKLNVSLLASGQYFIRIKNEYQTFVVPFTKL